MISGVALDDPAVLRDQAPRLRESIKMAAFYCAATPPRLRARALPLPSAPKLGPDEILPPPNPFRAIGFDAPVVCIGASTGGTEALREVLCALPPTCPPILVVQHMPRSFTTTFAKGMNTVANIRVREAEDGMTIGPGQAVIATGDRHLLLSRRGQHYAAEVRGGPSVSRHRPSVDVLFRSAASVAGRNVLGVLMTGMGSDGAQCLGEILSCGGMTIAQDQRTSVVFGMPGEAVRLGHAQHVLPLDRIAGAILAFGQGRLSLGGAA